MCILDNITFLGFFLNILSQFALEQLIHWEGHF